MDRGVVMSQEDFMQIYTSDIYLKCTFNVGQNSTKPDSKIWKRPISTTETSYTLDFLGYHEGTNSGHIFNTNLYMISVCHGMISVTEVTHHDTLTKLS